MAETLEQFEKTIIDNTERDAIFARLREIPENNKCVDCEKKNPKWASSSLGVFICMDCAGKHRQYGVAITFVRSLTLDTWTKKQILVMETGGNAKALDYFKKNGAVAANAIDYKNSAIQKYKQDLNKKVENILKTQLPAENAKLIAVAAASGGSNNNDSSNVSNSKTNENIEETKAGETKQEAKPEEKFVCNLQNQSNAVAKGFDVSFKKQNNTFGPAKGKVQAKKINDIDFENLSLDDNQFNRKPSFGTSNSSKMVSNENNLKFEPAEQKNVYKAGGTFGSTNTPQVNDKLDEMKKKNITHISSDVLFSKNETNYEDKVNFSKFSNSTTSISSNQFYGKEDPHENDNQGSDKMEQVKYAIGVAGEKMKQWKENAGDYLKKVKQNWT